MNTDERSDMKPKTYGEAIHTKGTKLNAMREQLKREHAARMEMTPQEREAYWKSVCEPR
jgi:hypothetical protein